jgi:endonuclease G
MNRKKDLQDLRIQAAMKAYESWIARGHDKNLISRTASVARQKNFYERERLRALTPAAAVDTIPLERKIGPTLDIRDLPPNELARKAGRPVARLHELNPDVQPEGFGTGFLIAPNLLITNHHVFPSKDYAAGCAANFLFEKDNEGRILHGLTYKLRPDTFFFNYDVLDFALVYVDSISTSESQDLNLLGMLPLISTRGKVIEGSHLSIIQYPMGGYKKYAYEENVITSINDTDGNIEYTTDTLPASSGSPGFNEAWEVAALHYTGVPAIVEGKWRTKTGAIWDKNTMSDDDIMWIANAGKSISKIVGYLKTLKLQERDQKFINTILNYSVDPVLHPEAAMARESINVNLPEPKPFNQPLNNNSMEKIVMNFSGPSNVYLNQSGAVAASQPQGLAEIKNTTTGAEEKKIRFDEDYSDREGYNENFLDGFTVPMPGIKDQRLDEMYKAINASKPLVLNYHHYSLVMNKTRRFQMWSAVNVDYSLDVRDTRDRKELGNDSNAWRLDPRIPAKYQVQADEFYDPATLVDKGHIVRRDDNCWASGAGSLAIEYANADTFHWTNCTPQHERFNRDMMGVKGLWGILENEIKRQLNDPQNADKDYNQKACVLAGPVLSDDDPEYNDIT